MRTLVPFSTPPDRGVSRALRRRGAVALGLVLLASACDSTEPNLAPWADAGPDQEVDEQTVVALTGSAGDPDGRIVRHGWEQAGGPTVALSSPDRPLSTFTGPVTTERLLLTFVLSVEDDRGATAADTTHVTVNPVNAPPAVSAGAPQTVPEQTDVTLSGTAVDADGSIVALSWTQIGGAPVTLSRADRTVASFRAPVTTIPLTLAFRLSATDNEGTTSSDTTTVQVLPVNEPPTVFAGSDRTLAEGSQVVLEGTAEDADGTIESVSWVQTAGPSVQLSGADRLQATFTAPSTVLPLTLRFSLTVVDNEGAAVTDQVAIEVVSIVGAGFHYSRYSPAYAADPRYLVDVGKRMAGKFPFAEPQAMWVLGVISGQGPILSFPGTSNDPFIRFSEQDENEAALSLFDQLGMDVWLVVEPGDASVVELIHLLLRRYGHHRSVVGVGIDIEWYRTAFAPVGKAVTDAEARAWVEAVRSHGDRFRLFLTHWEQHQMPPTVRDGILFVDDSQQFRSLDHLVTEFKQWGEHFSPAPVGFLYGFPSDARIWGAFPDPAGEIGRRLLQEIPNTESLFWLDATSVRAAR